MGIIRLATLIFDIDVKQHIFIRSKEKQFITPRIKPETFESYTLEFSLNSF